MRVLIYGFGPYGEFKHNITEKIVRSLATRRGVHRAIFPVRFNRSQFVRALRRCRPDAVLGLGQCARGRGLRIERRAVNRKRARKKTELRPIVPSGSKWLATDLQLARGREARFSRDAGDYVCNFSMYVMLDYLKRNRLAARFGFVHVPYDYSFRKARRFVVAATRKIRP